MENGEVVLQRLNALDVKVTALHSITETEFKKNSEDHQRLFLTSGQVTVNDQRIRHLEKIHEDQSNDARKLRAAVYTGVVMLVANTVFAALIYWLRGGATVL